MKLFKQLGCLLLGSLALATSVKSEEYNIKYSSNYIMPAYVHFQNTDTNYSVKTKINVPFYNIQFYSKGIKTHNQFKMIDYKDLRNDDLYSVTKIKNNQITYGKVKNVEVKNVEYPVFDLFTIAYQLTYFDQLPTKNFYVTNGKQLYLIKNAILKKSVTTIEHKSQHINEISYLFSIGNKDVVVKKYENEKFPRYISYNKGDDHYELTFSSFVK